MQGLLGEDARADLIVVPLFETIPDLEQSDHIMRDFYTHTDLILAGMWGGVGGLLPNVDTLFNNRRGWRTEGNHIDQDLLSETVWPAIRGRALIHDSVFTGCLGSVPFPPYADLPPGHHIGQNAFMLFSRSS